MSLTVSYPAVRTAVCLHCGTPFRASEQQREYCCAGCHFVHDLIKKNGLNQFYDLRDAGAQPVKSLVFQKRDYTWLRELVRIAEARDGSSPSLSLDLQGISCIGCVWLVEKIFAGKPGALDLRVDPTLGRLEMRWAPGVFDVVAFAREIQSFGYLVGPLAGEAKPASRALVIRLGMCGALALNTMLFTLPGYLGMESSFQYAALFAKYSLFFSTLSLIIGGGYFFARSWRCLRQGVLHIDLPISLGLLGAYACSVFAWAHGTAGFVYFDFVAVFTFFMLAGRWLQQKAVERNCNLLLAAQNSAADVHRAGSDETLPIAEIEPGTRYAVAPGQPIPVRSKLSSRGATLGLEWISGESEAITQNCRWSAAGDRCGAPGNRAAGREASQGNQPGNSNQAGAGFTRWARANLRPRRRPAAAGFGGRAEVKIASAGKAGLKDHV